MIWSLVCGLWSLLRMTKLHLLPQGQEQATQPSFVRTIKLQISDLVLIEVPRSNDHFGVWKHLLNFWSLRLSVSASRNLNHNIMGISSTLKKNMEKYTTRETIRNTSLYSRFQIHFPEQKYQRQYKKMLSRRDASGCFFCSPRLHVLSHVKHTAE